jgi:IS30 family transposase
MAFSRYGQNILILHERSTRLLIATRLPSKQAAVVAAAMRAMLAVLPTGLLQTMAFDNGTERPPLRPARAQTRHLCDTHSPWQKGGIENAIGRMRRFLPRKTDIAGLEPDRSSPCSLPTTTRRANALTSKPQPNSS